MDKIVKILLIDDEAAVLSMMRRCLEDIPGYKLDEASDGLEAVLKFDEFSPGVILMDINVPWLDGLKMTQLFKRKKPEIKIIAVSGMTDSEMRKRAADAGADAFVKKPFSPEEIRSMVADLASVEDFSSVRSGDKITVFIAEDHYAQVIYLKGILEEMGSSVSGTSDSGEGLTEKIRSAGADIVIMDYELRGKIDGIEASRDIVRELSLPVIMLTATESEELKHAAASAGIYDLMTKPFDNFELRKSIELALIKRS